MTQEHELRINYLEEEKKNFQKGLEIISKKYNEEIKEKDEISHEDKKKDGEIYNQISQEYECKIKSLEEEKNKFEKELEIMSQKYNDKIKEKGEYWIC